MRKERERVLVTDGEKMGMGMGMGRISLGDMELCGEMEGKRRGWEKGARKDDSPTDCEPSAWENACE